MLIHIPINELEDKFKNPWKLGLIKDPSIDYATNAIHGWFGGRDEIIFKFKDYGFINDNKSNTYSMSCGEAGITILIEKK
tara:strand:- start:1413 stop:1652 length:240 start_codon:yes stop_codon:yes gene_type:complete